MKKVISIMLSAVMLMSIVAGLDFSASASTYYESESNDTYASADTLSPGNSIIGNMRDDDDVDYYKIVPTANGKLKVNFQHTYIDNSYVYWYVSLYRYTDGQYYELSSLTIRGYDNENIEIPSVGAVSNGVYYLKVSTYYDTTAGISYTVSASLTASEFYEKELNETYYSATTMSTNKTYYGCMQNDDDKDYYKIVAPSNGKLSFTFNHKYIDNSYVYWYVSIIYYANGQYNTLYSTTIRGYDNEKITLPFVGAVKSGTYFVCVSTYYDTTAGNEYSITNNFVSGNYCEKELNETYDSASSLSLGDAYYGTMNSSDDVDLYKLYLSAGQNIKITFAHTNTTNSYVYWYVDVIKYADGQYTSISDSVTVRGSDGSIILLNQYLQPGTYFVKVSTYYDTTAGVSYNVKADIVVPYTANLKATAKSKSVNISWSKSSGATGYEVQQYKSNAWKTIKTTSSAKYTVSKLSAGKKYNFRVRAYKTINNRKFYSNWSTVTVCTKPSKVTIEKLSATKKSHAVSVSWKKPSGAVSGYQVNFATDKNFKNIVADVKIKDKNKTSCKGSGFKKGKKYYVRVRAYKTIDGKKYKGSWSDVKSIKAK